MTKKYQWEAVQQQTLFEWAALMEAKVPELRLMYHVPNGGSRNSLEAANLKRQGVKAGVPDVCLPVARGNSHGLYIEMKAGDNKPTEKQKEWLTALEKQGYATAVCYSWEDAVFIITNYLKGEGK
jgi:hypothetical protein